MDPVERLIYRSNILGADARITNTGGGNTSSKIAVKDPLTGEPTRVLWVKGSGGDLRTATKANFASLYLDQVLNLRTLYEKYEQRGPKTPAEDAMVGMYPYTTFDRNPTASSIDTPLHAFIPFAHVDHMHPVAVIALATAKDGPALTQRGLRRRRDLDRLAAARLRARASSWSASCREHPNAKGAILGQHGLINWANDDKECYELTLDLIRRAQEFLDARAWRARTSAARRSSRSRRRSAKRVLVELLPWLRGKVSAEKRQIATVEMRDEVLRVRELERRAAPRRAGHELPRPLPAHEDQAALRRLESGGRRCRRR